MRRADQALFAAIAIAGPMIAIAADVVGEYTLDIQRQTLRAALIELSNQTGFKVSFVSKAANTSDPVVGPLRGTYSLQSALNKMVDGTGITFEVVNGAVIIRESRGAPGFQLARLAPSPAASPAGAAPSERRSSRADARVSHDVEEVIVTAQKRQERLIDVPQSVTVVLPDELAKTGAVQFRDVAASVPGMTFTTQGAGETQISLRGVTTGTDVGPTVGIYVDEVPYGSSTVFGQGVRATLDLGVFDLERVEVLRGPQGTLYGASTMGGLIKYVTKRPNADDFGFDVQTGGSSTADGGSSYQGSVAMNAPLVDEKAALRVSGYYSHDGGFIDAKRRGVEDVNESDVYGGRVDLLVTPNEAFSARITGLAQNVTRDGEGTADYTFAGQPQVGELANNRLLREPFDQQFRLASATLTYDFGSVELTSASGYQTIDRVRVRDDGTPQLGTCTFAGLVCGAAGAKSDLSTDKFTQEIRLAADSMGAFDWRLGAFYTEEDSVHGQELVTVDLAGQPFQSNLLLLSIPSRYEEYAGFSDVTWKLTEKFDVTGGVRFAHNRQRFQQFGSGRFGRSSLTVNHSEDDVTTYLANARYHFTERATAYLRYATGYRPGGPNVIIIDPVTGQPTTTRNSFDPDRLNSYEVGFKGETAERRLGMELTGFYIDWNDIQVTSVSRGGFGFIINAPGGASVRGAELTLTARATDDLMLSGAVTYQDAQLDAADPNLRGRDGEALPNVPQLTAALSLDYALPVTSLQPSVGFTVRYVDDREASFDASTTFPQYQLPEYTSFDLRVALVLGRIETQLYARNLFDERGQMSALTFQGSPRPAILQPRTIGISFTTHF